MQGAMPVHAGRSLCLQGGMPVSASPFAWPTLHTLRVAVLLVNGDSILKPRYELQVTGVLKRRHEKAAIML